MQTRTLGSKQISPLGMGCWAIGGPFTDPSGKPQGWGEVDDCESIEAVRTALEHGVSFFDTADVYGVGRSERVLGEALKGRRDEVVLGTKFGNTFDEAKKQMTGTDATPEGIRRACEASLKRLQTDYIDLYQFHLSDYDPAEAAAVRESLEDLVGEGLIRAYAWSTDDPARAAVFAEGEHCAAVQHELSVLHDAPRMLALCEKRDLMSIDRSPLAMGLLSGKFTRETVLPEDDVRGDAPEWLRFFRDGRPTPEFLGRLEAVREVLTSDGRSLVQGALAWLWGRSDHTLPIPGARTPEQAKENAEALAFGPLTQGQLEQVGELLSVR